MKEFGEFERQAVMIHEQLAAGEIYYEARDQLAKLADKLKGHRRTPRETPTVNPVFIVDDDGWRPAGQQRVRRFFG